MSKPLQGPGPAGHQPVQSKRGQLAEAERRRREAAALRENLAKRKAQQRSRRRPTSVDKADGEAETQE
jgi:hypothetical protein